MRQPILIDCDGVVCDFMQGALNFINKRDGTSITPNDVRGDIRDEPFWGPDCEALVRSEGFCYNLPKHEDFFDLPKILMKMGERVVFVTSPFDTAPTWCYERTEWLKDYYGVTRDDIIFARSKQYVDGKFLIDDLHKNIVNWESYGRYNKINPKGILVDRPWNQWENLPEEYKDYKFFRVGSLEYLVDYIKRVNEYEKI